MGKERSMRRMERLGKERKVRSAKESKRGDGDGGGDGMR